MKHLLNIAIILSFLVLGHTLFTAYKIKKQYMEVMDNSNKNINQKDIYQIPDSRKILNPRKHYKAPQTNIVVNVKK